MATTYLDKTFGSAGNRKTWTWSAWVKLSSTSGTFSMLSARNSTADAIRISLPSQSFEVLSENAGVVFLSTNRLFRDVSAWYHLVVEVDTTQATASNRVKMYVNGVQETSFSTGTYPSQNYDFANLNNSVSHKIGQDNSSQYFDGSMTHIHFIDGTAYDADTFGETDATTGIWKPKTAPSVTYGTNGFFLKGENSGALGTDSSGEGNDFTVNGTPTQTVDTPSNVFATWNPLGNSNGGVLPTFSNGNTTSDNANGGTYSNSKSTFGVSKGKYYCEAKVSLSSAQGWFGLAPDDDYAEVANTYLYENSGTFGGSAYGNAYVTNDILQLAFDANTGTVWFGINGTWQNSATQTEIENGTTSNSAVTGLDMSKYWHIANKGFSSAIYYANFGNGFFGTTAVASATTDESGLGIFEYDVPTGYYALCTKNINEQEYS